MLSRVEESPFQVGAAVIVYLGEPREKIWGILLDLNPAGVSIRGIDLRSFDDWIRGIRSPEESAIRPSTGFYPLSRVEKILLDEPADGVPSLQAQCLSLTGKGLRDLMTEAAP